MCTQCTQLGRETLELNSFQLFLIVISLFKYFTLLYYTLVYSIFYNFEGNWNYYEASECLAADITVWCQ